ncbi:MAG: dienelactone hydrolase family protein [Candidatus Nitrosocosmicus sp.]
MSKKFTVIAFLSSLSFLLSYCLLMHSPSTFAQQTTGLSAMTLASFSNNSSSLSFNLNNQPIENKTVNYFNDTNGYLVFPSSSLSNSNNQTNQKENLPAVVMIHENKGLNNYIKDSANILAKHGYVVLAVDLFNGETTADQNRAGQLTSKVREKPGIAIENMKSAVRYLSSLPNVNASKIASLGWCFGGGQSLQLALNSQDHPLAATVIYYGVPLTNDTKTLANIKWPVLGIFGDKDRAIPVSIIKQFQKALNESGIINEIHIYPGVGHAFANPSNTGYAPKETADAWKKTLVFLGKYD